MATMKPKPFQDLLDEAREYGIAPFAQGEFGASAEKKIAELKRKIERAKKEEQEQISEPDLPTSEELLKKLQESEEPVLVRVVEWKEWLPGSIETLLPGAEAKNGHDQKMPLSNGITGFVTGKNERLVELNIENTSLTKVVKGENDGKEQVVIYSCYVFQAILVQNNVKAHALEVLLAAQAPPEPDPAKGRNKANDLVVVERGAVKS